MRTGRVEPELHDLRRAADELAERGRETPTTVHLLQAIVESGSPSSELLFQRRLGADEIQRLGRGLADEFAEPLRAAVQRAHELAARMGLSQASAARLLLALLGESRSAARRVIDQAGLDVARLRTAVMQLALGV